MKIVGVMQNENCNVVLYYERPLRNIEGNETYWLSWYG